MTIEVKVVSVVMKNSSVGSVTVRLHETRPHVRVSFPVHSCVPLPPGDFRSFSPDWSLDGTTVRLVPEGRRS